MLPLNAGCWLLDVPAPYESGGGPPHSRMLARVGVSHEYREASWSAPALWRSGRGKSARGLRTPKPRGLSGNALSYDGFAFQAGNAQFANNPTP